MYAYKSCVLRNIEVFENEPETVKGILKFFGAYSMVMVYLDIFNDKAIDYDEINSMNKLINAWRNASELNRKNKLFIYIMRIIDAKYKEIHNFLYILKDVNSLPESSFMVNRRKVRGCIGTVVD